MTNMTTKRRITILPSPHDQLDPVAAFVRWWTRNLADVFAGSKVAVVPADDIEGRRDKRLPHAVSIALSPDDVFVADVVLPRGGAGAHAKALALRIGGLAPLDLSELEWVARRAAAPPAQEAGSGTALAAADGTPKRAQVNDARYLVAMARTVRLNELERVARRSGARQLWFHAEGSREIRLMTARATRAMRRGALIDVALLGVALVTGMVAVHSWTQTINRDTDALVEAEQSVRSAAVARERSERDNASAEDFIARGVLERRVGAVARDISVINAATPDTAWWRRVRWQDDGVTVAGTSAQASVAIEAMSDSLVDWTVALSGPVRSSDGDDLQSFELRITRAGDGENGG